MTTTDARLERARVALEGLSIGDAFGECFFVHPDVVGRLIMERALPAPPWPYTDDTEMALSLVSVLRHHGTVDQDALAQSFAERANFGRGYGSGALRLRSGAIVGGIIALRTGVKAIPVLWRQSCEPPPEPPDNAQRQQLPGP